MRTVTRKQEPVFEVTLNLRVTTTVSFVRIEPSHDSDIIRPSDAIENAIWSGIPKGSYGKNNDEQTVEGLLEELGFELAHPIDGEAKLILRTV